MEHEFENVAFIITIPRIIIDTFRIIISSVVEKYVASASRSHGCAAIYAKRMEVEIVCNSRND